MNTSKDIDRTTLEVWLSPARYARYLDAASNDDSIAFELYLWNEGLAQAVLRDVSFFEIALRNAYAAQFDTFWNGDKHWLFDDESPIRRPIERKNKRKQVTDANRINRNAIDRLVVGLGKRATSDNVISNLTLGFWAHMTDRSHERNIWIPFLHNAWPAGTSRKELNGKIESINEIRNRAAHHEHLFNIENGTAQVKQACNNAVMLFSDLQPDIVDLIYGENKVSSVDQFLMKCKPPCEVKL